MKASTTTEAPEASPQTYADIFEGHPSGVLVLEDLVRRFTRPAVTDGGIDAVLKTYQRVGERRVLDHILTQINRAHGVPDTQGEATNE
jgi:hypothetical protein